MKMKREEGSFIGYIYCTFITKIARYLIICRSTSNVFCLCAYFSLVNVLRLFISSLFTNRVEVSFIHKFLLPFLWSWILILYSWGVLEEGESLGRVE